MNVNPRFAIVKSRILMELSNMDRLFMELHTRGFGNDVPQRKLLLSDPFMLRAVGSILHDFYTCIENMFRVIARSIDESTPDTAEWHSELLQQMSIPLEGIRTAVIHQDTVALLNEFRGFRHIFRNIYGFNLVGERMERLLKILPSTLEMLKKDLSQFIVEMEEVLLNP